MFGIRVYFDPNSPAGGGGAPPAVPPAAPPVADDWRTSLPVEIKDSPSLKDVKTVSDLAKGYIHAQKAIGNNVAVPGKDSKPEEWAAFFQKAGRPESPEKYDFGKVEGEDKIPMPPELKQGFLKSAHEFGLSNRQAAQLYSWFVGTSAKGMEEQNQAVSQAAEKGINSLKTEWGSAYEQNLDMAKSALKEFGGDEAVALMNDTGLGNDPRVIKLFQKIGRAVSEDKLHTQGKAGNFKMTPVEATATIGQKMTDTEFMKAYTDKTHAGHAAAVKVMSDLYAAKNP